jgi:hypothetical protein
MVLVKASTRRRRKPHENDAPDAKMIPTRAKGGNRHNRHDEDLLGAANDESFFRLFLHVAAVLAVLCLMVGLIYSHFHVQVEEPVVADDDRNVMSNGDTEQQNIHVLPIQQQHHGVEEPEPLFKVPPIVAETARPPLPHWNISDYAEQYDAYALAQKHQNETANIADQNDTAGTSLFWQMAGGLRDQFAATYGGENVARGLLVAASTNYGGGVVQTACRLQMARHQHRPFRFAFGGYSVTAGRGNYFSQSFPLVMEQKLHPIFHELNMELIVRNAAVGGCPSFPYGWCLENFWGLSSPDAVSWDFSMNEAGGDPLGFEAYLRRIMQVYSSSIPQLLMIDTAMALERRQILEAYDTHALVIHRDVAVEPFLKLEEKYRPEGFQNWRKFGAPNGAPGQSYHHPAVKEHEFIAWVLVMHFLSALELLMLKAPLMCQADPPVRFTRPLAFAKETALVVEPSTSIFFGQASDKSGTWTMNPVHCRTSFDPILHGNLTDIVVAGSVGEDMDVMLPKSKMFYNKGWVLNLSEQEKAAKRSLNRFGGLGFVDNKRSYYGIFASGPISFKLSLPRPGNQMDSVHAKTLFRSIVVCETNEKRDHGACEISRDVGFTIGGVNASKPMLLNHTQFLGKPVCVFVDVPVDAKALCLADQCSLEVNASVVNRQINDRKDACSISHIVWEEQQQELTHKNFPLVT